MGVSCTDREEFQRAELEEREDTEVLRGWGR